MDTYRVVRYTFRGGARTVKRGLTLPQAQAHCSRPDTHDQKHDPPRWFDGYTREQP